MLWFIVLMTTGCDKYTKHKVLTFFFTGVPPIEEENTLSDEKEKKGVVSVREKKKITPPVPPVFVHGPYGAKLCDQCHSPSGKGGFRSFGGAQSGKTESSFQGMIGQVKALDELCTDCHMHKSVKLIEARGLQAHKPVSDGMCTTCHNGHQSQNLYMLMKEKTTELCATCHFKGDARLIESHSKNEECISCHNAHMGKGRFLLKKDFDEIF
ncbi:MAG: cytochrome c3 family protein [Nitrospirota bacterium]